MPLALLPPSAAWRHVDARIGFEVAYIQPQDGGHRFQGCTTAVEDAEAWVVTYDISCDDAWRTRQARITGMSASGTRSILLSGDGRGSWSINGAAAPDLAGCLDVDLESSMLTNTLPVHRLAMDIGEGHAPAAAYVRATDLTVRRLEQTYRREADDDAGRQRYRYAAPVFDFATQLVYDESGLVLDYPGIARRAA